MPQKLENLTAGKIASLTNGGPIEFIEDIDESEYTINDLEALLEAERAGKNREEVIHKLKKEIGRNKVSRYLDVAQSDVKDLEEVLDSIGSIQDISEADKTAQADQETVVQLLGDTVPELKEFINTHEMSAEDLEKILEAEREVKGRKTAIKFLESKIEDARIKEDFKKTVEDAEKLENDLEDISRDTEGIGSADDQEGSSSDEETVEDDTKDKEEDTVKEQENETKNSKNKNEEEKSEEGEKSSKLEQKKEINDRMDLGFNEGKLKEFELEELQEIEKEKEKREDLISKLKQEDMDEERLRNSSTPDLEKIWNQISTRETEEKSEEKSEKEIREEAQEDLEMLMGAVKDTSEKETTEESFSPKERFQEFRQSVKDRLDRGNEDEEGGEEVKEKKFMDVLESYRSLDDTEASIKIAHVMKGYLESELGIEKELTYGELADNLPQSEEFDELRDFFNQMDKDEYTGNIHINDLDDLIDECEWVLEADF